MATCAGLAHCCRGLFLLVAYVQTALQPELQIKVPRAKAPGRQRASDAVEAADERAVESPPPRRKC